jgi:hypothetical protein
MAVFAAGTIHDILSRVRYSAFAPPHFEISSRQFADRVVAVDRRLSARRGWTASLVGLCLRRVAVVARFVRDSTALVDGAQLRDLGFGRGRLDGLEQGRLIVVEPGVARGLLGLLREGGDLLGATDLVSLQPEVAGGARVAAFVAMATVVRALAFILRNLRRMKFRLPLLLREVGVLRDLFVGLQFRQLGSMQVLADRPHPGVEIVHLHQVDGDTLEVQRLQRLDAVPARDQDIAAVALDDGRRGLQADVGDRLREGRDRGSIARPRGRRHVNIGEAQREPFGGKGGNVRHVRLLSLSALSWGGSRSPPATG